MNLEVIKVLNTVIKIKDEYTSRHNIRVKNYAVKLAKAYGLSKKEIELIKISALLHDIGKIGIPESILNKKERLTDEEFKIIKKHPIYGWKILKNVNSMTHIASIIRQHHERHDGEGYPDNIKGKNILLESSILSIADSYDAMISRRPYKKPMTQKEAIDELKNNKRKQFDPELVDIFIEII